MRKIYILLGVLILPNALLFGQISTAMNWYFGSGFGITFASGTPELVSGSMYIREGSATYSDPHTGDLMFYTDGTCIWDREHNLMPGSDVQGLTLSNKRTATQPALIIPHPCDKRLFYICNPGNRTLSASEEWPEFYRLAYNSFSYQLISMTERGGLGDVIEKKVIRPDVILAEKITGVYDCSSNTYTIITIARNGDVFYIWRIGENGLEQNPQVIDLGNPTHVHVAGHMKLSPDGTMLAMVEPNNSSYTLQIFNFDIQTGIISNPINLDMNPNDILNVSHYGLSFSPNSRWLYTLSANIGFVQFSLDNYDKRAIYDSRINIDNTMGSYWFGSLQIGPDGKLYCIHDDQFVSVLENPNEEWSGFGLHKELFDLQAPIGSPGAIGTPNFMDYMFGDRTTETIPLQVSAEREQTCPGTGIQLQVEGSKYYVWSPGALLNDSTIANPIAYPHETTTFTATSVRGDCSGSAEITISVVEPEPLDIIADTTICLGDSIRLWASDADTFVWEPQDGLNDHRSAAPVATPQTSTLYHVRAVDNLGCEFEDSVWVIVRPQQSVIVQFELPDTSAPPGTLIAMPLSIRLAPSDLPQKLPPISVVLRFDVYVLDLIDVRGSQIRRIWREGNDAFVEFDVPGQFMRDSVAILAEPEFLTLIAARVATPLTIERITFDEEHSECALSSELNDGAYNNHEYCLNYTIEFRRILTVKVAPNPVSDYVDISVQRPDGDEALTLSCKDAFGREIWHDEFRNADAARLELRISTSNWPAGMYTVSTRVGAEFSAEQLMVIR